MTLVADSSFLIALLKGEKWAESIWDEVKRGRRIYISTASLAVASMSLWKEGGEVQVDILVAALRQALNVSLVLFDVKIALEAGRFMHSMGGDLEGGAVIATALLKDCDTIVTKSSKLAEAAKKYGLKTLTPRGC
ncbi:MAG: type II toxin-antitoxin system VapC family toxin [Candidatus Freyarchaeota archaeon]|nr:type II toxin-antitoxin system VapC family toxin [Candidatus Jordarchaeia archaeon]